MCDLLEVVPRQPAAPLGGFLGNKGEMNGGLAGLAWRWIGWRRPCAARVELRAQAAIVPLDALVAQLDRASDFESEGREFESLRARQIHQKKCYVLPRAFFCLGETATEFRALS